MRLSHRDACRAVARWFLSLRWCYASCVEIKGRVTNQSIVGPRPVHPGFGDPDAIEQWQAEADQWFRLQQAWKDSPASGGGVLDVLAVSHPTAAKRRVAVAEIKVSRADLLADLRASKMLRYQPQASHCYLAGTHEAFARGGKHRRDTTFLDDLTARGLPESWGVISVNGHHNVSLVRRPKRHDGAAEASPLLCQTMLSKIARSLSYRVLNGASPVEG